MIPDPITITEAARITGLSAASIRYHVREGHLEAEQRVQRHYVSRQAALALVAPQRVGASDPSPKCRVIAVVNQKGGSGKTTTAVSLAYLLSKTGPVLAIDCDPQGNLTQAFGLNPDTQSLTVYDVLVNERSIADCALPLTNIPGIHLVPANLDLADAWRRLLGKVGVDALIRVALNPVVALYRYVIIDCPPSLDMVTMCALVAATEVIVPVDMSLFSVRGMTKLMGSVEAVRKVNPTLPAPRILICRTDNTTVSATIEEQLRKGYGANVFGTVIPRGTAVPESHLARTPLPIHAASSKPAIAYARLADEVNHA
jgi:chromosome partitioning protein